MSHEERARAAANLLATPTQGTRLRLTTQLSYGELLLCVGTKLVFHAPAIFDGTVWLVQWGTRPMLVHSSKLEVVE